MHKGFVEDVITYRRIFRHKSKKWCLISYFYFCSKLLQKLNAADFFLNVGLNSRFNEHDVTKLDEQCRKYLINIITKINVHFWQLSFCNIKMKKWRVFHSYFEKKRFKVRRNITTSAEVKVTERLEFENKAIKTNLQEDFFSENQWQIFKKIQSQTVFFIRHMGISN